MKSDSLAEKDRLSRLPACLETLLITFTFLVFLLLQYSLADCAIAGRFTHGQMERARLWLWALRANDSAMFGLPAWQFFGGRCSHSDGRGGRCLTTSQCGAVGGTPLPYSALGEGGRGCGGPWFVQCCFFAPCNPPGAAQGRCVHEAECRAQGIEPVGFVQECLPFAQEVKCCPGYTA